MSRRVKKHSIDEFTTLSPKHLDILKSNKLQEIEVIAGINEQQLRILLDTTILKARSIIAEARASLPQFKIFTLDDIVELQNAKEYLSSGCKSIDRVMGGRGFQTGALTEIYAQFGAGKSQIGLTLAVRALLPKEEGGLDSSVVVIDTEGTWRPERIKEIASYYPSLTPEILNDNIRIVTPLDSATQHLIVKSLVEDEGVNTKAILKVQKDVGLLIVDSVTSLFRSEYLGRGVLAERQNRIGEHLKNLYMFGIQNKAIVLITNQVIHSPDPFKPGMQPVGGNVLGHASTYRVAIKKKRGVLRVIQMIDSATLPDAQGVFKLHSRGVVDVDYEDEEE